jgi:hypothetical protein
MSDETFLKLGMIDPVPSDIWSEAFLSILSSRCRRTDAEASVCKGGVCGFWSRKNVIV